ncbi:MAG: hypothetical protein ACR2PL_26395 [Dehalococcoidia bacterium]
MRSAAGLVRRSPGATIGTSRRQTGLSRMRVRQELRAHSGLLAPRSAQEAALRERWDGGGDHAATVWQGTARARVCWVCGNGAALAGSLATDSQPSWSRAAGAGRNGSRRAASSDGASNAATGAVVAAASCSRTEWPFVYSRHGYSPPKQHLDEFTARRSTFKGP